MSDTVVNFTEELITSSDVKLDPPRCPRCDATEVTLYGNMSYPHEQSMSGGAIVHETTDWDIKQPFELISIDCLSCFKRFTIMERAKFELEKDNAQLRQMVVKLTGKDPYGGAHC